jgi:CelD/BcsL family acetyltransferase involved in cellulose biosynthesis
MDEYLRQRGSKYAREVRRCRRLLQQEGDALFVRATTPDAIARGYSVLEEQQAAQHEKLGEKYILGKPQYRDFYERLVMDGSECDLGYLFTLEAGGQIVATLFGIQHNGTFTMLRISTGGQRFSHVSPGRLIVLEAMGYFVERGVRKFDLGLGATPFKRGLGAVEVPLYDLIVARDLAGYPRAAFHRWKGRIRKNKHLQAFSRRWRRGTRRLRAAFAASRDPL